MEVRGQPGVHVCSLSPQYRSQESNSGPPVWWQALATPKPIGKALNLLLRETMFGSTCFTKSFREALPFKA